MRLRQRGCLLILSADLFMFHKNSIMPIRFNQGILDAFYLPFIYIEILCSSASSMT